MTPDSHPADAAAAVRARFEEYLRRRGLNVTKERRDVLGEVFASQDHFDAKGLLRRLTARGRHVSRATLYRTLDLLVDAKIVTRLEFGDGEAHFEILHGRSHHDHFLCVRCGRIIEFEDPGIESTLDRLAAEYRFQAEEHELHVRGLCSRCQPPRSPS
jgi:Fur family ferric uptake transcriptional regulator